MDGDSVDVDVLVDDDLAGDAAAVGMQSCVGSSSMATVDTGDDVDVATGMRAAAEMDRAIGSGPAPAAAVDAELMAAVQEREGNDSGADASGCATRAFWGAAQQRSPARTLHP